MLLIWPCMKPSFCASSTADLTIVLSASSFFGLFFACGFFWVFFFAAAFFYCFYGFYFAFPAFFLLWIFLTALSSS